MKLNFILGLIGAVTLSTLVSPVLAYSQVHSMNIVAENAKAKSYHPGFWQPIAHVNPSHPIGVRIINYP
ncbi:hypothetical protein [Thermocoleostomius sinensis]|uniref:Uncharacterized protein n=1 Tax=Thermocoleostomius sinensis A174 TaxID=2016057 RepID=A0A9E8ZAY5_9CYAN|nr:hypothetical protein [Thermocoleostomius sinensis]WAL59860.1 hypothetical protein OXH18_22240 [Thermocoleostomius sinensis A174]